MFELLLTVCLLADPTTCKTDVKVAENLPSENVCMNDMADIAKWIGENPAYAAIRWRCRDASKPEQDA